MQEFTGAQFGYQTPFTFYNSEQWQGLIDPPAANEKYPSAAFINQAKSVLHYSATLNDTTKCLAAFSNGNAGVLVFHLANKYSWTLDDQIRANFLMQLASYEVTIAAFCYKGKYDSVRPETVIRKSGLFKVIQARGGKYNPAPSVTMNASDWQPYLAPTPPEPEYPSGATCRDVAYSSTLRLFTGSDELEWNPVYPQGGLYIEPGFAPTQNTTVHFPTFTSVPAATALGRQTGGYHFKAATDASINLCNPISDNVYRFGEALFKGQVPTKYHKKA